MPPTCPRAIVILSRLPSGGPPLGSDRSIDDELLARYRDADFSAFDQFYQRNETLILSFLMSRLGNRADAEEAFQETFLRIHRAITSYDPAQRALPWVITIARNVAIDLLKRRGQSLRRHSDARPDDSGVAATAETALAARQELNRLLHRMSPSERTLLERRLLDDEDFDVLARDLGTTNTNVRQRFSRLVRKLRT